MPPSKLNAIDRTERQISVEHDPRKCYANRFSRGQTDWNMTDLFSLMTRSDSGVIK